MSKVNLKLSHQHLNALVFQFNALGREPLKAREVKVARSVLDKVVLKMRKKHLETQCTPTLFAKPKKVSFGLEYYEAHYLEQFLVAIENFPMNDYDRNVCHLIKSNLNQQLA